MAIEQRWPAVAPKLFTANGGQYGIIKVADARGFKVKQKVAIVAVGQPNLELQVKTVIGPDTVVVGPFPTSQANNGLSARTNLTAYTIAAGAYIYAEDQPRVKIKPDDIWQAVYEQEPTVALRTIFVDEFGDFYGPGNPLPIAFDGTVSVGNVTIQDDDGDELEINPDGSINVNIINSTGSNVVKNTYAEASAAVAGVETTIATYVVPLILTGALLQRVSVSGENVGRYRVFVNGTVIDTRRTYYGGAFNEYFEFSTSSADGHGLYPGDTVVVKILHDRPFVGNFQSRIQALEIA